MMVQLMLASKRAKAAVLALTNTLIQSAVHSLQKFLGTRHFYQCSQLNTTNSSICLIHAFCFSSLACQQQPLALHIMFAQGNSESTYFDLTVTSCHPGYRRGRGGLCECDSDNPDILRCDTTGRYLFIRVSVPCTYIEFAFYIIIILIYVLHYNYILA